MGLVIAALYVGDHPQLFPASRSQTITLDVAYLDEEALRLRLEGLLGGTVHQMSISKVDLVRDTTTVDVSYRLRTTDRHNIPATARMSEWS